MTQDSQNARRVVVTGLGMVSPLGIGVDAFTENLADRRSGIRKIQFLSASAAPENVGGEAWGFDEKTARKTWLKPLRKQVNVMCREIQLGAASALMAVEQAGIDLEAIDQSRMGVDFGANLMFSPPEILQDGCWKCVEDGSDPRHFQYDQWGSRGDTSDTSRGMNQLEPLWLLRYLPNMPACHISIALQARGPSNSLTLDESSGNSALGEAHRIIQRGKADIMIAGATGTRLHSVKTLHAAIWDELAKYDDPPETWCRPFDESRRGQVIGEGSCSFILEDEAHAKARGANVWGTLLGTGSSCAVGTDGTPNPRQALANAMRSALREAQISPADVGHINAHGLATKSLDLAEAEAIYDVFESHADQVPVTAIKSYTGNSGAGCGTIELAASIVSLKDGKIPPTLNYTAGDSERPLNVVHGDALTTENRLVLNVNVTRMAQATAVLVKV